MSRLLLLFICLIWIAGVSEPGMIGPSADLPTVGIFLAPFALVVVIVALWSRWIARRLVIRSFSRTSHTLNWLILASRGFVVTWFGAGVFTFGWAGFVMTELHGGAFTHARLPGLLLGTLPAFLAWIGLWWAQYPAEHALRQQSMIENLVDELPIHRPPTLAAYVTSNLRLQLLFTVLPVILIAAVHDTAAAIVLPFFDSGIPEVSLAVNAVESNADKVDGLLWLLSAGSVFVLAPEVLRRILQTTPMQDGPLRRRLEALSERSGIRCRDILVWHTHFNVGNAAVMGLLPRYRYVLLSDLLLERMDDDQIEAVFAHEVGHVVHRHMAWYVVFFVILLLLSAGPGALFGDWVVAWVGSDVWRVLSVTVSASLLWLVFGFLSRRFERQADVFAARMMEAVRPGVVADGLAPAAIRDPVPRTTPIASHVGAFGAHLFASALHRVATINNLPVTPRHRRREGLAGHVSYFAGSLLDLAHDWLHGSIPSRMNYLRSISADPALTTRFDRVMGRLYSTLLFALIASAAYVVPMLIR